jgi:hypothetical protein
MRRLAIVGLLATGSAVALPACATAQGNAAFGVAYHRDARGVGPAFRHGFDRGWREGTERGLKDARRGRDPRFWRDSAYRDGDRGYRRFMGPRWDYVAGYREGYASAYRRAWASVRPGPRGRGPYHPGYDDRYRRW